MQEPPPNDPNGGELQFEHAEVSDAQTPAVCAGCSAPLEQTYWEINGKVSCEQCHQKVLAGQVGGSRFRRFVRAVFFGCVGALIAGLIWGGVRWATGYEVGYVAIVVGIVVGAAVRHGSRARGGFGYQFLAAFLTYFAICTTYVPILIAEYEKRSEAEDASTQPAAVAVASAPSSQPIGLVITGASTTRPASALQGEAGERRASHARSKAAARASRAEENEPAFVGRLKQQGMQGGIALLAIGIVIMLLALLLMCILAMALPIVVLLQGQVMGPIIIGIAVWTAWRINRREQMVIHEPFELAVAGGEPAGDQ